MTIHSATLLLFFLFIGSTLICSCQPTDSRSRSEATENRHRDIITITSANKPKNDAEALMLVGITMSPPPQVEYQKFEAGLDDHFDLVIRFPKNRLDEFWGGSKWSKEDSQSLENMDDQTRKFHEQKIGEICADINHPFLHALRRSTKGIWCDNPEGILGGLRAYLALDQYPEDVIVYIEWFEV